jgi:methyl-accepting chemotaxis protein
MPKMTLNARLVLSGIALVLVPTVLVSLFSINRSTKSLDQAARREFATAAKSLAVMTQVALSGELSIIKGLAIRPTIVQAASSVAKNGMSNSAAETAQATRELTAFQKQVGNDFENIVLTGIDGVECADGLNGANIGISLKDREYFKVAMQGKTYIGAAVKSKGTGNPIVPVCTPVLSDSGAIVGTLTIVMKPDFFGNIIANTRMGETGYAYLVDQGGIVIAHPDKKHILNTDIKTLKGMEEITRKALNHESGSETYSYSGTEKIAGYAPVELAGWTVVASGTLDEQFAAIYSLRKILAIFGALILVSAVVLAAIFARKLSKPLMRIVEGLNGGAEQVAQASGQIAESSRQLAEGTSEQAASIEETSSSLEEMASMTKQNAENANQANRLVTGSKEIVSRANQSMNKLTATMGEISRASEDTSKIIKTIDEIAFQTNLLALNAAVEAARAGEAGAGFAVVADEVRNLAMRAAEAAKTTADLIEGTVKKIKEGSALVEKTNDEFHEVAQIVGKSSELVGEISAASQEQSQGIEQINKAVGEMDKVVQRNAGNAEESASASEELSAQAGSMKDYVTELTSLIDGS